jgi:alkanesulfonate monooxygenase SsuD/methylene tetrahydromethanopterin reductase-like flavin-dependent oxidoreductase (luciferase family)
MTVVSINIPPDIVPEEMVEVARRAESAGVGEVWLWEDCFGQSGTATAAAILAATERVRVAIGLLPVPLRNVALTAMEIATLARMFPGRLVPAIGHGVQSWMAQAGVRAASPLTMLEEHTTAIRRLLAGETVTTGGRYVQLDRVALRYRPEPVPPLLLGAEGPRTLELAGRLADGIVVSGELPIDRLASAVDRAVAARREAGVEAPLAVVRFASLPWDADTGAVSSTVAELEAVGITDVGFIAVEPGGPPVGPDQLLRFVDTMAGAGLTGGRGPRTDGAPT